MTRPRGATEFLLKGSVQLGRGNKAVTVLHSGATPDYAGNWERAFATKPKRKATAKATKKKSAPKKAASAQKKTKATRKKSAPKKSTRK